MTTYQELESHQVHLVRIISSYWSCTSKKLNNDNHLVYTLHGDGELQEGQNWEAIMYALLKK
jgi:transketolase